MLFVPVVPPAATSPPPRVRKLADELSRVLTTHTRNHPTMTRAEVRQAVRLALEQAGVGKSVSGPLVVAVISLLTLGIALGLFLWNSVQAGGEEAAPAVALVLLAAVFLVAVGSVALRLR